MILRHERSWWKVEQSKVPQSYSISPGVFGGGGWGGRAEYKITKIKAAVNIKGNTDPNLVPRLHRSYYGTSSRV